VEKAAAMLYYSDSGVVPNLIHSLKYRGQERIGHWLGSWYGLTLSREPRLENVSVVLPVPLHARKQRKRGYNQSAVFGRAIAERLGAFYCGDNLYKRKDTPTQTTKNRWKRWKSAAGAFGLRRPSELEGKDVLLVDDVLTTGATLESCLAAMETVRDKRIFIAVIAIVPDR
jgi:ComF family protein